MLLQGRVFKRVSILSENRDNFFVEQRFLKGVLMKYHPNLVLFGQLCNLFRLQTPVPLLWFLNFRINESQISTEFEDQVATSMDLLY